MSIFKEKAEVVTTSDGSLTLRHPGIDEEFHSMTGALTEAKELYIVRGGFGESLARGDVEVLDVGLGLGYNALLSLRSWLEGPGTGDFRMVSLELEAELAQSLSDASGPWMEDWSKGNLQLCRELSSSEVGFEAEYQHPKSGKSARWTIVIGDALVSPWKQVLSGPLTHIWQDAFSPKNNPTLWSADWFSSLAEVAAPGCVIMTYSVARTVRDAMSTAGFNVNRIPGYGKKRHWLKGIIKAES